MATERLNLTPVPVDIVATMGLGPGPVLLSNVGRSDVGFAVCYVQEGARAGEWSDGHPVPRHGSLQITVGAEPIWCASAGTRIVVTPS